MLALRLDFRGGGNDETADWQSATTIVAGDPGSDHAKFIDYLAMHPAPCVFPLVGCHHWLDATVYGTHTMRQTKVTLIYKRTKNLRAVQLLLGHSKLESTVDTSGSRSMTRLRSRSKL